MMKHVNASTWRCVFVVVVLHVAVIPFLSSEGFDDTLPFSQQELVQRIEDEVQQEIKHQRMLREQKAMEGTLRRQVELEAKQEIKRFNKELERKNRRDRQAGRVRIGTSGNQATLYTIPSWPFRAMFYTEKDLLEIDLHLSGASRAYSSTGRTHDISRLIFGEKDIVLKDILLASRLLSAGKLRAMAATDKNNNLSDLSHYYSVLAHQSIVLDASTDKQTVHVNYARHFHDGDITFGLQIPIVRRKNSMKFSSQIASGLREDLKLVSPKFFQKFSSLENFFEEIMRVRNISFNRSDSEVGIGDVQTFLNVEVFSKEFERLVIGGRLRIPSASDSMTDRLWKPLLGNGGFTELGVYASILWDVHNVVKPYLLVDIAGAFPAHVSRRVPVKKVYDGVDPAPNSNVGSFLTLGGVEVQFKEPFSEFDVTCRNMASTVKLVKIHPGPTLAGKIGAVFDDLFYRGFSLDIFADIHLKGTDYIGGRLGEEFNLSVVTANTFQSSLKLGFDVLYQIDSRKRFSLGAGYVVAGRNVLREVEGAAAFNFEF